MLIILIWLGSLFPEKYFNVIEKCEEYPQNQCVLLGEGHWVHYLKKYRSMLNVTDDRITRMVLVERADVLRLLYIYDKGGLYTDLDNDIDYPCLYDFIGTRNESFFSQEQKQPQLPSNNLIFAPEPRDPKIKRVINLIQECPTCDGLNFASPYFLKRITVDFVDVKKCVNHLYHSSWYWWGSDWEGKNISPASAQAYAKCVKDLGNCQNLNKNCTQNSSAQLKTRKEDAQNLAICQQSSRSIASSLQTCKSNNGICLKELQTLQQKDSTPNISKEAKLCQEPTQKAFEWTFDHTAIAFVFLLAVLAFGIFIGLLFERRKDKDNQKRKIMISSEMESIDTNFA